MNTQTLLTDGVYVTVFVGCLILEHFSIIPAGTENILLPALLGGKILTNVSQGVSLPGGGPKRIKAQQFNVVRTSTPDHD